MQHRDLRNTCRRLTREGVTLGLVWFRGSAPLPARDLFVVLSGGVSPLENNYSQYLQARAFSGHFEKQYPRDSVWTFFGAGNVTGQPPVIADVRRKTRRAGLTLDSWLPGSLPRNRPARREVILRALREEILPAVTNGGTLFLFVGDHGSRPATTGESQIDLWELTAAPGTARGWRSVDGAALGVKELRDTLAAGMGKGRVVFCMTQCHSGGFHSLGMPDEMLPNLRWFTHPPAWAEQPAKIQYRLHPIADFTATDQFSPAAGCDPDPKSDEWAGYERFVPKQLLDLELLTLQATGRSVRSLAEAHVAATLRDFTIDKPSSTSDEYLERWATLLDDRLSRESNLTARVQRALEDYQSTVDGTRPLASDPAFRERQQQFARFVEQMGRQNPGARALLFLGTRRQLEEAMGPAARLPGISPSESVNPPTTGPRRGPRGGAGFGESRRLWRETIRPAWKLAVENGEVTNTLSLPLEFERHLLRLEDEEGRSFWRGGDALAEEVFWFSGHGSPQTMDSGRARLLPVGVWCAGGKF